MASLAIEQTSKKRFSLRLEGGFSPLLYFLAISIGSIHPTWVLGPFSFLSYFLCRKYALRGAVLQSAVGGVLFFFSPLWQIGLLGSMMLSGWITALHRLEEGVAEKTREEEKAQRAAEFCAQKELLAQKTVEWEEQKKQLLAEIEKWKEEAKQRRIEKQTDERRIALLIEAMEEQQLLKEKIIAYSQEPRYKQLQEQFEAKRKTLDQTRQELYRAETEVLTAKLSDFKFDREEFEWVQKELSSALQENIQLEREIALLEENMCKK